MRTTVAIVGAGPYGLSLAAHLAARNIEHRILGDPMLFWSKIALAGGERYLKSYCFGTNISSPKPGYAFADYSKPRGLETFEPCSMMDFADYGRWFQQDNVAWAEPVDVSYVTRQTDGFVVSLANGERFTAAHVVVATGLAYFAHVPPALASLPSDLAIHTSCIANFASYRGRDVAVIGADQSALEAAALLYEAGARPQLLVRENNILWMNRVSQERSIWRRIRSPISGLGTGPKAWTLTEFPGMPHRVPAALRTRFVKNHLPAERAWWLRDRVVDHVPIHFSATVIDARPVGSHVALRLCGPQHGPERELVVDQVIAGSGYNIDVESLDFLHPEVRGAVQRVERAPRLNAAFESSIPGLSFIGPASAMSFGPLFRFVVGAEYTARVVVANLASRIASTA